MFTISLAKSLNPWKAEILNAAVESVSVVVFCTLSFLLPLFFLKKQSFFAFQKDIGEQTNCLGQG